MNRRWIGFAGYRSPHGFRMGPFLWRNGMNPMLKTATLFVVARLVIDALEQITDVVNTKV